VDKLTNKDLYASGIADDLYYVIPATIPEGMVLVSVAKLEALKSSISGNCYQGQVWEIDQINEVISAAQGECNAD